MKSQKVFSALSQMAHFRCACGLEDFRMAAVVSPRDHSNLLLGAFDLKQRCAECSLYDIKYRESDKKAVGSYAFESFSRYFDVIR